MTSAENGLRPDVTPEAVVALRLAADAMPISRPGQQWSGAADWLRRRADAFEVALRDAPIPPAECANPECDHDRSIPSPGCALRRIIPPGKGN